MRIAIAALLALLSCLPVQAEVVRSSPDGMLVRHEVAVAAAPAQVYRALGRLGSWWNPEHTWSGRAQNLDLEMVAGGCLCERWKDGSAEHGRVVMAKRDELLRLHAALGPLQEMAVAGSLTFALAPAAEGTTVTMSYRVSGDASHALDKLAPVVDTVVGDQLRRLQAHVDARGGKDR